jgi:hypothetical protein
MAPNALSMPLDITFLDVSETEHLLDNQEELISTPLKVKFESTVSLNLFLSMKILKQLFVSL